MEQLKFKKIQENISPSLTPTAIATERFLYVLCWVVYVYWCSETGLKRLDSMSLSLDHRASEWRMGELKLGLRPCAKFNNFVEKDPTEGASE